MRVALGIQVSVDLTWMRSRAFQGDADYRWTQCLEHYAAFAAPTGVVSPV